MNQIEQEQIIELLLTLKPDLTNKQLAEVGKIMYGIEFTRSNFRRAKESLGASGPKSSEESSKIFYLRCLVTLHPHIPDKTLIKKSLQFFNEKTRPDLIAELRERPSIEEKLAQQTVFTVEAPLVSPGQGMLDELTQT